jgi:hypothetical protein
MNLGNSVSWRTTGWTTGDRFPSRLGFLFSAPPFPRAVLGPSQPPIQCVQGSLCPGLKRSERNADHSPASCAEVHLWSFICIPPVRLIVFVGLYLHSSCTSYSLWSCISIPPVRLTVFRLRKEWLALTTHLKPSAVICRNGTCLEHMVRLSLHACLWRCVVCVPYIFLQGSITDSIQFT